jgi:hypothetical protein
MTSWLRTLGLRVALVCLVIATVLVAHVTVAKRSLPFVLFDSFDLAYSAAERKVAELEAARPAPASRDVSAILRELERLVGHACELAAAELDAELTLASALPPARRGAVLGCIEHHLRLARDGLARASDPELRAEYRATCERLRQVRDLV